MRRNRSLGHAVCFGLLTLILLGSSSLIGGEARAESIEVDLPNYGQPSWKDGRFDVPGAALLRDMGRPELPVRRVEVLIPRDRMVVDVRYVTDTPRSLGLRREAKVFQGEAVPGQSTLEIRLFDDAVVAAAGVYPPVAARLGSDQYLHGYHLVGVEYYPVRQELATGEFTAVDGGRLELELAPREDSRIIVDRERDVPGWREQVARQVMARVANPSAVTGYPLPAQVAAKPTESAALRKTPSLATSPVRYLIVTNAALAGEFQRLADHRTALGLPALVVTVEDILANYRQGLDLAETIRLYVSDAYSKWGVDYLLIGGDSGVIPPRYVRSTFYPAGGHTDIPADLYFGGLDGNWNDDGDFTFGEPFVSGVELGDFVDFTPEVAFGRAPVSNVAQAQTFVDKVLEYEIPTNTGYQAEALFASEVLFPQDWELGDTIQLDGAVFSEDLVNNLLPCDPYGSYVGLRQYQNDTAWPGSVPETKASILNTLSSGTKGLFDHIGHGFFFNMSVGDDNIVVGDADALTNAPNYFTLYALNCSSAAFDFNCLLERFMQNPNGGSVASIGACRAAFPNSANGYQQEFFEAVLCDGFTRLGDAMNESRLPFTANTFWNTPDRWTHFTYTLLGDPAMPMWPTAPRAAVVSAPASTFPGKQVLNITVTDQATTSPLVGATVTFSKNNEDYVVATTDGSGMVSVEFDAETLGDIDVWVSGQGTLPTLNTVSVVDPAAPALAVDTMAFSDDGVGASIGNGNGRLEGGERIEITPSVLNAGSAAFGGGTLTLTTSDAYLTIIDGTAAIGAISGGGNAMAGDAFVVDVGIGLPDGHEATITITADDGGAGSWPDTEVVLFKAAELEVVKVEWNDAPFGNGNGTLDLNEDVEIVVTLKNFGAGSVQSVTGALTSADAAVTIIDGNASWAAMANPLDSADNSLAILRASQNEVSSPHLYDLSLTDDQGRVQIVQFDLDMPAQVLGVEPGVGGPGETVVNWFQTADVDLYGYRVYRRNGGTTDPFTVASPDIIVGSATFRDSGLAPLTSFDYVVSAIDTGRLEGPLSDIVTASTAPSEISCFPLPMDLEASASMAVDHVDLDGVLDMVIGADKVLVIDGNCAEKLDGDADAQTFGPITDVAFKFTPPSIALGDLDGIAGKEIVTCNWGSSTEPDLRAWVFDEMGNVLPGWPVSLRAKNWSSPVLGDLDNDGDLEIVIHDVAGYTYAFHHDGTEVADGDSDPGTFGVIAPRATISGVNESFGRMTPALYDVDGDNNLEILYGTKMQSDVASDMYFAYKTDGSGTNAAGWPKVMGTRSEFLCSPAIADINNDGIDEIMQLCENDSMYVWHPDGSNVAPWPKKFTSQSVDKNSLAPSIALGNFTNDAFIEMVIMETLQSGGTRCQIVDHLGNTLPGWPLTVVNISESSPVVGDINGDGELDVILGVGGLGEEQNFVHGWNKDGTVIAGFPILLDGFARATPTLTDFNGDGNINLLLASWDKLIHVWDLGAPYNSSLVPWPTFRGNVYRNGIYDFTVPTAAPEVPGAGRAIIPLLHANVPNPFNPRTVLSYEVPQGPDAQVRLSVYDAAGRLVVTLLDSRMSAGSHEATWLGQNEAGKAVASGVYFARLEVDGHTSQTRKMALVR